MSARSESVYADLQEDVSSLCAAFANKVSACSSQLEDLAIFTFGGKQLESGIPLRNYGISKGSNVQITCRLLSSRADYITKEAEYIRITISLRTACPVVKGAALRALSDQLQHDCRHVMIVCLREDALSLCRGLSERLFGIYMESHDRCDPLADSESNAVIDKQQLLQQMQAIATFTYNGKKLQPGVPLKNYNIKNDSIVCLTCCLRVRLVVHTPFTEMVGYLELVDGWKSEATIDANVFRNVTRSTHHCASLVDASGTNWKLYMWNDPGVLSADSASESFDSKEDAWNRLLDSAKTVSRIHVKSFDGRPCCFGVHGGRDKILKSLTYDEGMTLHDIYESDGILLLPLLRKRELVVYDTTQSFHGTVEGGTGDLQDCCICLDSMSDHKGQMLRRLPCMHVLHASCAMRYLPKSLACPLCRCSLRPHLTQSTSGEFLAGVDSMSESTESDSDLLSEVFWDSAEYLDEFIEEDDDAGGEVEDGE
eukprot:gnl/MRDRNA2_/MRDRNA2_30698_c0_seq1.p1 gnl/MRDRNA2_/MRDRNA2_30698_c0~~gnl/MRDRNA2_/MRDRNA2_30698_c0_seq1.p1  ORF type:complete len:514 (-),score=58.92 gnl/MRDRNA2_/MRDRNA2_30698_c0_seq1:189-1634(-)